MSLSRPNLPRRANVLTVRRSLTNLFALAFSGLLACDGDSPVIPGTVEISVIEVDSGARILERGALDTLTATVLDENGDTVDVQVAWRSSNEKVAVFQRGGVLVALDTGVTLIVATSLGVVSDPEAFRVNWTGPATITGQPWTPLNARGPNGRVTDSMRVLVTNQAGAPVSNARVAFNVTTGGGSVSPTTDSTDANGIASAQFTLGPVAGTNTVIASVIRADGSPDPLVANNAATFSLNSYDALSVAGGDNQTGQILSDLPTAPSVRLMDSLGAVRAGVPVTFTASANGRVATSTVSTGADGVASPGTWTLGDRPGDQTLEARVEDALIVLHATGTGTPIHYKPARVVAGGFSTCALESDGSVKCWGQNPQNGSGGASNTSTPTAVAGSLVATSLAGGPTHYCAVTSAGEAWCWGVNAGVDTSGATSNTSTPTKMPTDIIWSSTTTGFAHTCGISTSQTTYCWGTNSSGQLGDLTTTPRRAPVAVSGGFAFSQLSGGAAHTCALTTGGSAFCWGNNQFGQIGDGSQQQRTSPTAVSGAHTFQSVGAGETLSCGLATDGKAYCWGVVTNTVQATPSTYPTAPTFVSMSVGAQHACALTGDGTAYCWGNNTSGQLGDSTTTARATPTVVAGNLKFTEISAGTAHTCARTTDGAVACWGRNQAGEIGNNTTAFQLTPRHIVLGVTP